METEKEIEYKSTIMEMGNIIKNQERVIEQWMFDMLNIKIDIEEVDEVVDKSNLKDIKLFL
jgi:hypothetical protein